MPFCRRGSSDRLLQQLYQVRKLHLIPPVVGTEVGDLIIVKPGGDTWPARLSDLFGPPPESLVKQIGAPCADIEDKVSGDFEAGGVVGFLQGIAAAMGVEGSAQIAAAYGSARTLRVRARSVTSDTLDLGAAGRFIRDVNLRGDQGVFGPDDELYMIREVLRARAIEVAARDARNEVLKVSAESTGLAEAKLALSARNDHDSTVVFAGKEPAAFAVRLVRIAADPPGWAIEAFEKAVIVRGRTVAEDTAPDAIIGDPENGPLFLEWTGSPA